jgi:hypothetical protein
VAPWLNIAFSEGAARECPLLGDFDDCSGRADSTSVGKARVGWQPSPSIRIRMLRLSFSGRSRSMGVFIFSSLPHSLVYC